MIHPDTSLKSTPQCIDLVAKRRFERRCGAPPAGAPSPTATRTGPVYGCGWPTSGPACCASPSQVLLEIQSSENDALCQLLHSYAPVYAREQNAVHSAALTYPKTPPVMFTFADLFGHVANLIYAVGSSIRGALALRSALVLGAFVEILYDFYVTSEPLWTSIFWCLIIIGLNVYQIVLILLNRRKSGLSPREQELHRLLFSGMDLANFRKMIKTARWEVLSENRIVITENELANELFLLAKGTGEVTLVGKRIAQVKSGSFIGEMSLLTGQVPTATVQVAQGATLVSWSRTDMQRLQQANSGLENELYAVFSRDIIEKIKHQNLQLAG